MASKLTAEGFKKLKCQIGTSSSKSQSVILKRTESREEDPKHGR